MTGITKIAKEVYNIVDELGTKLLVIISRLKAHDAKIGNKILTQVIYGKIHNLCERRRIPCHS